MRKAQKSQIEDFLQLLFRAHEGIKTSIEVGKKDSALDLLGQCQDGAIQIGEMIESIEGEGFITISYLEDYCESVYQIYESVRQNQKLNPNKIFKHLRTSLTQAKNSVKNDIKIRKEVVFLPYKASMWDSLESVYKAAAEDPDCDAYVIPIPYFDKNPDGSFREEHYEGDLYPKDIPITWYQDYDFENRQPDLIFIHNPYDECNYVTSVHPFFYSKNLKQFTETLVYIPYFILNEVDPENALAVEEIKHFCTVPAVIYADKVIVQSEDMRKIYINVMTEYAKGSKADRKYWEEKILGLGSPKVDKVFSTKIEEIEIPKEWLKVIEKTDGSWKKIIFYNTSVTSLLEHGEKMLIKMQDVFRVFKEHVEEVALLWRPHPLIQATIESMRPELWEEYRELVAKYKEEGWGIYDDTAQLERAIALCDGYYGDHSSVVKLCQEAGKAVMVQDISIKTEMFREKFVPQIVISVSQGQKVWFVADNYNGLFGIDVNNGKCDYVHKLKNERFEMTSLVGRMIIKNSFLIMTPVNSQNIHIYDISRGEMVEIESSDVSDVLKENIKFSNVALYNQCIYFFPAKAKTIIKVDLFKKTASCLSKFKDSYIELENKDYNLFSKSNIYVYQNKVYIVLCEIPYIMEFQLYDEQINYYKVDLNDSQFCGLVGIEEYLYILCDKDKIIKWNIKEKSLASEYEISNEIKIDISLMNNGFHYKNNIFFLSYDSNYGIKFDMERFTSSMICLENEWNFMNDKNEKYHYSYFDYKDKLYLFSNKNNMMIINLRTKELQKLSIKFDTELVQKDYELEINNNKKNNLVVYEKNNFICIEELFFNENININKKTLYSNGKKVYNKMFECSI